MSNLIIRNTSGGTIYDLANSRYFYFLEQFTVNRYSAGSTTHTVSGLPSGRTLVVFPTNEMLSPDSQTYMTFSVSGSVVTVTTSGEGGATFFAGYY